LKKTLLFLFCVSFIATCLTRPAFGAVKAGETCTKAGSITTVYGKKFTCIKSGKKLVWNSGPAESKVAVVPTSPSSLSDLYQNRNGIAYAAWKSTADSIAAGKSNIVNLTVFRGPNTLPPKYATPEVAIGLVSRAFSSYQVPQNIFIIQYSVGDIKWADEKVKSLIDSDSYSQLNRNENGHLVDSNCGANDCFGAKQVSTNSGIAFILQGIHTGNNNDPMGVARWELGQLEAHEFTHALQRATVSGQPTKEWPTSWITEGSAELAQNLVMSYKSYDEYMKWRKLDSSQFYGNNSKITTKFMTNFLDSSSNKDYQKPIDTYYAYSLGSRIVEIFVALKGPGIMLDLFRETALQGFEPAFKSLFGTPWSEASPIINKTIVDLFQSGQ